MSDQGRSETDLTRRETTPSLAPVLKLGNKAELSLDGLDETQRRALIQKHAELEIERDHRTQEKVVDTQILGKSMETATDAVLAANDKGVSSTLSIARDDTLGRIEMRIGNTEADRAGKLSRSGAGFDDRVFWIGVLIAAILGVVIVAAVLR